MSLLGFDAVGRLAPGQLPKSSIIVLPAAAGSHVLTGTAVAFKISEAGSAGSHALSGVSAGFAVSLAPSVGACSVTGGSASFAVGEAAAFGNIALSGVAASFKTSFASAAGGYALSGVASPFNVSLASVTGAHAVAGHAANEPIVEVAAGGSYAIAFGNNTLIRTGADFDLVYGGIGHTLEEIERARQLARITRKTPAPIVHEFGPRPQPMASAPGAPQPPAIDRQAVAAQRLAELQAQQARAGILQRRRQAIEILLLAS
jgi:hypothetical protein